MSSKGSINYKSAAEFNAAMTLAFQTALAESPDEPALRNVADRIAAAAAAWVAYDAAVGAAPADAPRLERAARQSQEGADIALKKWYSSQWLGRQSRRGLA